MISVDTILTIIPIVIVVVFFLMFARRPRRENVSNGTVSTKLSSNPIVTILGNDILFDASMNMDDQTHIALETLSKRACIFVIVEVKDQQEADRIQPKVQAELKQIVDPENILFCQTALGRASMVRQLQPVAHIDTNPETVLQTSIFIKTAIITEPTTDCPQATWRATSFQAFMTSGDTQFFGLLRSIQ